MTLPVYPGSGLLPGLTFGSKWSPQFFNMDPAVTATGAQIDLGLAQYPLHAFELTYEFLRADPDTLEFQTMMGFLLQIGGTLGRFLYSNPADNSVTANPIGTGDGETNTFALTRTFGANGYSASEPVGQVDLTQDFHVYVDGVLATTGYTVSTSSPVANALTFSAAPASGKAVSVDMTYFYYCKLADNSNTLEKFMDRLFLLNKIALQSCRPGT